MQRVNANAILFTGLQRKKKRGTQNYSEERNRGSGRENKRNLGKRLAQP